MQRKYEDLAQKGLKKDIEINKQLIDLKQIVSNMRIKNRNLTEKLNYYRNKRIKSYDGRPQVKKCTPYQPDKQFKIDLSTKRVGRPILKFRLQDKFVLAKSKKVSNLELNPF